MVIIKTIDELLMISKKRQTPYKEVLSKYSDASFSVAKDKIINALELNGFDDIGEFIYNSPFLMINKYKLNWDDRIKLAKGFELVLGVDQEKFNDELKLRAERMKLLEQSDVFMEY